MNKILAAVRYCCRPLIPILLSFLNALLMPGKWPLLAIYLSVVWQLIQILEYLTTENSVQIQRRGATSKQPSYVLVIGILSARGNHEQRQAIRNTWLGHVLQNPFLQERLVVKFIVGDEPCSVPPTDRIDQYSCQPEMLFDPVLDSNIIAHRIPKGAVGWHIHQGPLGMDFRVNFPIVITQLGVFDSNSDGLQNGLTTRLYDKISLMEVLSVTFTAEDPGKLIGGSRFKPVKQYLLPKGFEGSIVAENFSLTDPSSKNPMVHGQLDSGGGLLSFQRVSRFGDTQGVFPQNEERVHGEMNQYAAGTFVYHAYVADTELAKLTAEETRKQRNERQEMWREVLFREENELKREMAVNDDILLVNVTDVYRNLPRKLLKFYSWRRRCKRPSRELEKRRRSRNGNATKDNHRDFKIYNGDNDGNVTSKCRCVENLHFNFTLKTDDDCFVNVEAIIKGVSEKKLQGKESVWWSSDWPVERVGKWREPDYTAPIYPSFACGAGNVLSADLVKWLALNADHLKSYQGEDVSMGIWLSAVAPALVNDDRWACGRECDTEIFTSPENDPEELREMWEDYQRCGDPCGCSEI
ncbi:UDP-GalNAc:beta-1,3-N-acetylgalactosaminyltransferase 2-like isoform X2 [Montipora foliosa]|uniref:UDP-GalNAc:beta-1, 3-N-acetylgalactosaminyltransferase 2-like isoform X2 n=1 Tax=Montipora foliosa TaxID=591990 RepID=UPI0035F1ED05